LEPDEHQVAERVAIELTDIEAVLEHLRPDLLVRTVVGQRDEAAPQVTGRRDAELTTQSPRRASATLTTAVTSDAYLVIACNDRARP
jgi:hypothetical protein